VYLSLSEGDCENKAGRHSRSCDAAQCNAPGSKSPLRDSTSGPAWPGVTACLHFYPGFLLCGASALEPHDLPSALGPWKRCGTIDALHSGSLDVEEFSPRDSVIRPPVPERRSQFRLCISVHLQVAGGQWGSLFGGCIAWWPKRSIRHPALLRVGAEQYLASTSVKRQLRLRGSQRWPWVIEIRLSASEMDLPSSRWVRLLWYGVFLMGTTVAAVSTNVWKRAQPADPALEGPSNIGDRAGAGTGGYGSVWAWWRPDIGNPAHRLAPWRPSPPPPPTRKGSFQI
jgi:hypothetical protein